MGLEFWEGFPDFEGATALDDALLLVFCAAGAALGPPLTAAFVPPLCAVFTAGLTDFLADFVTGLATLFFACLVFFFTLFLLAIAYPTQIHCPGNI